MDFVVNPAAAFGFNAKPPRRKDAMKANQAAGEAETENTKGKEGSAGGNTSQNDETHEMTRNDGTDWNGVTARNK